MPHCPRSLFDDILRMNWSVEGLKNLVIIGNRLDMYEDPWVLSMLYYYDQLADDSSFTLAALIQVQLPLLRHHTSLKQVISLFFVSHYSQTVSSSYLKFTFTTIVSMFEILPLPNDTAHFDVFNDLALEWIPEEKLLALDENFWSFVPLDPGARAEERRRNSISKKESKKSLKEQGKSSLEVWISCVFVCFY